MLRQPESNETVDLCIQWYFSTVEARSYDYMSGVISKLTWNDVKSLVEYKYSPINIQELASICFTIDNEYIKVMSENRNKS